MGVILHSVIFKKDYRVFSVGQTVSFRDVTLLVGDQGSGKSSLLDAVRLFFGLGRREFSFEKVGNDQSIIATVAGPELTGQSRIVAKDFETENARILWPETLTNREQINMVFDRKASRTRSHGEWVREKLFKEVGGAASTLWILDEPDAGLSPRSCHELARTMKSAAALGSQVICSVHSPIVMAAYPEVFSLEHGRYMTPGEFLESQEAPQAERLEAAKT